MTHINRRNVVRAGGMGLIGAISAPAVARAQTRRWRMVTSWPKRLPGPGMSAERVAERISALSGGRIQITVHAAGEVVPAFEVLDAVGSGVADMGHTAAFYWQGKEPAAERVVVLRSFVWELTRSSLVFGSAFGAWLLWRTVRHGDHAADWAVLAAQGIGVRAADRR